MVNLSIILNSKRNEWNFKRFLQEALENELLENLDYDKYEHKKISQLVSGKYN